MPKVTGIKFQIPGKFEVEVMYKIESAETAEFNFENFKTRKIK